MIDAKQLAERYVAVWNETDPDSRRRAIAQLWTPDGAHFVGQREVHGYEELAKRVAGSHEKNVRDGGYRFSTTQNARALHNAVTFHWEMIPAGGGDVAAVGLEFLILDEQGRILIDYQFIVG